MARKLRRSGSAFAIGLGGALALAAAPAPAQPEPAPKVGSAIVIYDAPEREIQQVQAVQPPPSVPPQPKIDAPEPKVAPKDAAADEAPKFETLTSAALGGTSFAMSTPAMIGDFGAIFVRRTILVPTTVTNTTSTTTFVKVSDEPPTFVPQTQTTTTKNTVLVPVVVEVPVAGRDGSGFKLGDNASPIPTDRIFFSWNGFSSLQGRPGSFNGSTTTTGTPTNSTQSVVSPVTVDLRGDLNREIFGFEKTFLDGNASIEIRAPIFQGTGDLGSGFNGNHFGDVTAVAKFALIRDPNGFTFATGMATTFPTGPGIEVQDETLRGFLFQPYIGYLYVFGDVYVQGFSSVVMSTASGDPTLMFNDIGAGYRFWKGEPGDFLRSVDSVFEVHVTTPLDGRGETAPILVTDVVSLTGGLHFGLGQRSILSLGLNVPISGPRPYDFEGLAKIEYRY